MKRRMFIVFCLVVLAIAVLLGIMVDEFSALLLLLTLPISFALFEYEEKANKKGKRVKVKRGGIGKRKSG